MEPSQMVLGAIIDLYRGTVQRWCLFSSLAECIHQKRFFYFLVYRLDMWPMGTGESHPLGPPATFCLAHRLYDVRTSQFFFIP